MSNRFSKELSEGVLKEILASTNSQREFMDEIKRRFPEVNVKVVATSSIVGNCEEGEDDNKKGDDSGHKNICECSQCHFNRGLRKLEEESKKRDIEHITAYQELKSKFGDNIDEYLSFYSSLVLTKRDTFKELTQAITEYGCACVTMEAVKRNIEEIKSGTK